MSHYRMSPLQEFGSPVCCVFGFSGNYQRRQEPDPIGCHLIAGRKLWRCHYMLEIIMNLLTKKYPRNSLESVGGCTNFGIYYIQNKRYRSMLNSLWIFQWHFIEDCWYCIEFSLSTVLLSAEVPRGDDTNFLYRL